MDRYQDLARELNKRGYGKWKVILIVVGALETVAKGLEKNLKRAGSNATVELHQKAGLG